MPYIYRILAGSKHHYAILQATWEVQHRCLHWLIPANCHPLSAVAEYRTG